MGLFDAIFGKKQPAPTEPTAGQNRGGQQPPPTESRLYQKAKSIDWDWDNPDARALAKEILAVAAPHFGETKIKEIPDDEHIDLRGTYDGAPVRFAVWMSFGNFWTLEMRCAQGVGELDIERDHEKVPKAKEEGDPWSDDEDRRVFVGKGIFFEGDDQEIATKLAMWGRVPPHLQARILQDMETLDIRAIRTGDKQISINQKPGLRDLPDPTQYLLSCASLMAEIKNALPSNATYGGAEAAMASVATAFREVSCKYCSSHFLLTAANNKCANCGAPTSA